MGWLSSWLSGWLSTWLVGLALGMLAPVHAQMPTHQALSGQDWAESGQRLPLTPHMRYFKEQPGQPLDWRQALDGGSWQDADPKGMAALHQGATLWMLVEVHNTSPKVQTRWVVADYWSLMDTQLFMLDATQPSLLAHQRSGQGLAPQDRALDTEKSAFAVSLLPGQHARLLMRVSGLYWSHMVVDAWDSAAYIRVDAGDKMRFAVVLGAVLALCVVLLLQRDTTLALVAVWMLLSLLLELAYVGLLAEYAVPARLLPPAMVVLFLGTLINSASSFVTLYFMGLDQHRFWRRWNWGLFAVSLVLALSALGSHSNAIRQGLSLLNVVQIVSNLTLLAVARLRGNPLRQWMAVVMATNFVLAIGRVVVRQFYVDPDAFVVLMNTVLLVKGSLVLTVIALAALQRRRELHAVRQRLQLAEQQQRESLQAAVDQRTTELQQALVAANEASRAKTDFLARVSHDLRSPLTSINGYAQLLQRVGGHTGRLAQTIRRSADHMLVMVNDLIEYASGVTSGRPEPRPVYIHDWLDDLAREATVLAARGSNHFLLRLESELPPVLVADTKRLRQMLVNLLDNAAKFTHKGLLELRVSVRPLPAVAAEPEQLQLQLEVHDSGAGIAPAEQARLFEPFYRTTSAEGVQGVGLGLSIVATWAKRLGGSVAVRSMAGQGSVFTLCLPVAVGAEADMAQQPWPDDRGHLPRLDGAGRQVWVVEDNDDIRDMLVETLRSTGFDVTALPDGADFLARMHTPGVQPPHLVLTDYRMPRANGAAVLRGVRTHWPGVPVVLLSATQKTMQAMGVARDEGFDASLMKPVSLADLRATLARLLHIAVPHDDTLAPEPQQVDPRLPPGPGPSAEELQRVCQWADMGALTDLTEWAEALLQRCPACAEFAQRMLDLLAQARFDQIRAMCAQELVP